jgi:signal transduction histidine kinase/DNA-binding response OmpR family regulator
MNASHDIDRFREHLRLTEVKVAFNTITSKMVLPLYFFFWGCDLIYVPNYKWEFLALRSLVVPVALGLNHAINTARQSVYVLIALFYVFFLSFTINIMIWIIGDPGTPYYAGLLLISVGALVYFPLNSFEYVTCWLMMYVPYYAIVLGLSSAPTDFKAVAINSFFIIGITVIGWVGRSFYQRQADSIVMKHNDAVIAKESNAMKGRFIAHMSHELRTPLQSVIGYSSLLLQKAQVNNKPEYMEELTNIYNSALHQSHIINEVLSLSKIEAGKLVLHEETFPVARVVNEVSDTLKVLTEGSGNTLTVNMPEDIGAMHGDLVKLKQILINLLNNANKFTKQGKITLTVSKSINNITFTVSDTGVGIPDDKLPHIFEEFYQVDDSTIKKHQGTGLGLAICRHYTTAMNGTLNVRSEVGKGTTFTVTLPLGELQEMPDAKNSGSDVNGTDITLRILLAEDSPVSSKFFKKMLNHYGHEVLIANDGREALSFLLNEPHLSIAILDLHMPEYDGFEVVQRYRASEPESVVPIMMLTADLSGNVTLMASQLGVSLAYKPIDVIGLLSRIYATLNIVATNLPGSIRTVSPRKSRQQDNAVVIDELRLKALQDLYRDDEETFVATIAEYFTNVDKTIEEIRQQSPRSTETIYKFLHTSKTTAEQIGAINLYREMVQMEQSDEEGLLARADEWLTKLCDILTATRIAFKQYGIDILDA